MLSKKDFICNIKFKSLLCNSKWKQAFTFHLDFLLSKYKVKHPSVSINPVIQLGCNL